VPSRVVIQCGDSLQELVLSNRVRLVWFPGHCGVHGNEEADALAIVDQVLLLWGRSLIFRWHLRVSDGRIGSGFLNHSLSSVENVAETAQSRLEEILTEAA
jgi:hypothetical protein